MKVPFLDLKVQYDALREELQIAMQEVLDRTAFAGGPFVEKFEEDFAAFCGTRHAVGVGSGTEAIWLALLALGVGQGDEVITVPMTFMATAEAITFAGGKPIFVDIEASSYTMDPGRLEQAITPRTRAVIPVHLYGQMAEMDAILAIAAKHGLPVIEDACQAHGAEYKGRKAGSLGAAGCFSFYPGKNLGAYGEAGAVVTNDGDLAKKLRVLRDHGQPRKYTHSVVGWNARMDGLQGAILRTKLKYLDAGNELRRAHAKAYTEQLSGVSGIVCPEEAPYAKHVYHVYAVRTQRRGDVMEALTAKGIGCGIHYPIPIHLQEAYQGLGLSAGDFPVSEECAAEELSLPMFPELTTEQIRYVADALREVCSA